MARVTKLIHFFLAFSTISVLAQAGPKDLTFSEQCQNSDSNAIISFVGDILVHHAQYSAVYSGSQKFSHLWERTNPLIQKADFSVGNLEGPAALGIYESGADVGDIGFDYDPVKRPNSAYTEVYYGSDMLFNFHPSILFELKQSGYDLISTANNHSLDRRSVGIDKTLEKAKAIGLSTVGTRPSYDPNAEFYVVHQINGINVAFIACTESLNGRDRLNKYNQILQCTSEEKILNMISVLSKHPAIDAVIILPHWGEEYMEEPLSGEIKLGRKFLNAGATAIIGSHPHVLQPWEKFITADGRETLIIYSLGNFVAWQKPLANKTSVVAYVGLSKNNGKTSISGVGYTPVQRPSENQTLAIEKMNTATAAIVEPKFGTLNLIKPNQSLTRFCR